MVDRVKHIKVCAKCEHERKCLKGEKMDKCDCFVKEDKKDECKKENNKCDKIFEDVLDDILITEVKEEKRNVRNIIDKTKVYQREQTLWYTFFYFLV